MDRIRALGWLAQDPDPLTRNALVALMQAADQGDATATAELADAFSGRLAFGTADLRGALGPGPNRMNRMVVRQAAAGLAAYLSQHGGSTVVIGFDARHQSDAFARESAAVFAGAGLRAHMLPRALPTPVLAYAVRHLGCDAGVMVTASHNPPGDNGYKVYLGDGSQIVPPADAGISAHIDRIASGPLDAIALGDDWLTLGDDVLADYLRRAVQLITYRGPIRARVAYTPMHGVGGEVFATALRAAGFGEPIMVAEQWDPDPDFPTVAFPNPEEPGAMDLAVATAKRTGANLVIANDPDADRCAVAIPVAAPDGQHDSWRTSQRTSWRTLTGDEVGSLLAWWIASRPPHRPSAPVTGADEQIGLETAPNCGSAPVTGADEQIGLETGSICGSAPVTGADGEGAGVFAQSIVSGTMLESIARAGGFGYAATLTGFKWISRVPHLRFGYEEALGYCVDPDYVRDKDGITAGLLIVELANWLHDRGRSLTDVLDDLDRTHGVHATAQVSRRLSDLAQISLLMERLRTRPPRDVAGIAVLRTDDLELGVDGLPPTDGIRLILEAGSRIIIRPSGTEPKVKCYLQVIVAVSGADAGLDDARSTAQDRLDLLRSAVQAWLDPIPD